MSEWLKDRGCKPRGTAYAGSNPAPPTSVARASQRSLLAAELAGLVELCAGCVAALCGEGYGEPCAGCSAEQGVADGRDRNPQARLLGPLRLRLLRPQHGSA